MIFRVGRGILLLNPILPWTRFWFKKKNWTRLIPDFYAPIPVLIGAGQGGWPEKPTKLSFLCKAFSESFHPMSHNYIDYMNVWYNMFYLQSYKHLWLIQFSRKCNTKFPTWFKKLWTFFGLLDYIFPLEIQEKFNFYKSKTSS